MELIAVRHGQSIANAAFAAADAVAGDVAGDMAGDTEAGAGFSWTGDRDTDVPLSQLGNAQSKRIGDWFAGVPAERRPDVVMCSSFRRARQTWRVARAAASNRGVLLPEALIDDRLADRRMGSLELLTDREILARFPREAVRCAEDETHFRPSGGESFVDVLARVAPLLTGLGDRYPGARLLLVTHDAVVLALRQLIEGWAWQQLLEEAAGIPVANGSFTRWVGDGPALGLTDFDRTGHLEP